jgi:hypothetical protein
VRPSELVRRYRDEIRAVRKYGADNPRVFGSVARGMDSHQIVASVAKQLRPPPAMPHPHRPEYAEAVLRVAE